MSTVYKRNVKRLMRAVEDLSGDCQVGVADPKIRCQNGLSGHCARTTTWAVKNLSTTFQIPIADVVTILSHRCQRLKESLSNSWQAVVRF